MKDLKIRPASLSDCKAIAELAQIAGEGIPGYFWRDSQADGESLIETGTRILSQGEGDFSWRNATVASVNGKVAGMLLAYRLPAAADYAINPLDFPDWARPMIELEMSVPESFYISMLACFEGRRGTGIGSALLARVDRLAAAAGCHFASVDVFSSNPGALRLYRRLGYVERGRCAMVESDVHAACDVILLTRQTRRGSG